MKEVYKLENLSEDALNEIKQLIEKGCSENKSNYNGCCDKCILKDMAPCYYITDKGLEKENTKIEYGKDFIKIITED